MNYEFFIAKKIIRSKSYKSSISSPIIKIGVTAIAIGIIVMLISIATGVGLQKKITKIIFLLQSDLLLQYMVFLIKVE